MEGNTSLQNVQNFRRFSVTPLHTHHIKPQILSKRKTTPSNCQTLSPFSTHMRPHFYFVPLAPKMSDTPSKIFHEILLRVPAESLLRFRAVCKAWRRIIDNPSFVKSHTNNQLFSTKLIIRSSEGGLQSVSLDSINFADGCQTVEVAPVKPLSSLGVPRTPELPVPSCNGLMLLSHIDPKMSWVILNPLTRDFHRLSTIDVKKRLLGIGLGYDSAADDYRVVRIHELYGTKNSLFKTLVYSLKLGCWKMIKNCPYCFPHFPRDNLGVFLNGSLHWRSWDMIIALDLVSEDYYQLPLPEALTERRYPPVDVYLDAFGGYLVLSYYQTMDCFVGWVMEDCKVEKSWRKLFSFEKLNAIGAMDSLKPVAYLKSKGQVVLQHYGKFFLFDIDKNSAKKVRIEGLPHNFTSLNCPASILKLDESYDVCRRVATKRTRAQRKKANASVKRSATITDVWCLSDSDYDSDSSFVEDSEDY